MSSFEPISTTTDSSESGQAQEPLELKYLTIPPAEGKKHSATVIFVHGLGDTGYGWKSIAQTFRKDPELGHIKWILPHAPLREVTAFGKRVVPAWFDVFSFGSPTTSASPSSTPTKEDSAGLLSSAASLRQIIHSEIHQHGIESGRIVLGGFSQGAGMTYLTGLTWSAHSHSETKSNLAGLVMLSGRFMFTAREKAKEVIASSNSKLDIPIFIAHGTADAVISISQAESAVEYLEKDLGFEVRKNVALRLIQTQTPAPSQGELADPEVKGVVYNVYEAMEHSTCEEEMGDLGSWLKRVLPAA